MIARTERLPQNCALASLNQIGRNCETASPSPRGPALCPVVTRLSAIPKLPLQDCARTGSASLQPDSTGSAVRSARNLKFVSQINGLTLVTSTGGRNPPPSGVGENAAGGFSHSHPQGVRARGQSRPEYPDQTTAAPYRQAPDRRRLPPRQPTPKETTHG